MASYAIRAGFRPVETNETWTFTTEDVRDYVQDRINVFIAAERQSGKKIPDIPITLVTVQYTKKFAPFAIMLPEEALETRSKNSEETLSVFENEKNEQLAKLLKPVWSAITSFLYTGDDKKNFKRNQTLRNGLDLTMSNVNEITLMCSPRTVITDKRKNTTVVICLLDPIRIFSAMVMKENERLKDGTPSYTINKISFDKVNHENYKYTFSKCPKKLKKKHVADGEVLRAVMRTVTKK